MKTKIILTIIVLIQLSSFLCMGQDIRLGIITDYKSFDNFGELANLLQQEIQKTVGNSHNVILLPENIVSPGNTLSEASQNYLNLSSRSDVIIAFGPVSTKGVTVSGELKTPTIGVGIIDQDIQDLPLTPQGTSGVKNFSYVLTAKDLDADIKSFFEITSFSKRASI